LLAPWPYFAKIRSFCKHFTQALKQFACLQSLVYGWSGLVIDLTRYALLDPTPFFALLNLGDVPVYSEFATNTVTKTIDREFESNKNCYMSYSNISCALF
jgi:hypothetical protein